MKLWIARQRNGNLIISRSKFKWLDVFKSWHSHDFETLIYHKFEDGASEDPFPEVTFENSPIEVELKLVNNDKNVSNEE